MRLPVIVGVLAIVPLLKHGALALLTPDLVPGPAWVLLEIRVALLKVPVDRSSGLIE